MNAFDAASGIRLLLMLAQRTPVEDTGETGLELCDWFDNAVIERQKAKESEANHE